jgi:hypothetical protein
MVSVDLTDEEHNIIKSFRKTTRNNRKYHLKKFSSSLQKQINRQLRNVKKFGNSYRINSNKSIKKHKIVEKTETRDGKIYKIIMEDTGDGKGLVKTREELLGDVRNMEKIFKKLRNNNNNNNNNNRRNKSLIKRI